MARIWPCRWRRRGVELSEDRAVCLGIPGRILDLPADQPDLGHVEVDGVIRGINLSLLADDPPVPGEWVLIHLGFALQKMTEAEVDEMNATRDLLFTGGPTSTTVPEALS